MTYYLVIKFDHFKLKQDIIVQVLAIHTWPRICLIMQEARPHKNMDDWLVMCVFLFTSCLTSIILT